MVQNKKNGGKRFFLLLLQVVCILLAAFGLILLPFTYADAGDARICRAGKSYPMGAYLSVRPAYASKAVHTDKASGDSYYALYWWEEGRDMISAVLVRGDRELDKALTDLQYFTYGVQDEYPDKQLVLCGEAVPLPDGIAESAVKVYNELMEHPITADEFEETYGNYYIDTGRAPIMWTEMGIFGTIIAVSIFCFVKLRQKRQKLLLREQDSYAQPWQQPEKDPWQL